MKKIMFLMSVIALSLLMSPSVSAEWGWGWGGKGDCPELGDPA